MRIGIDLMGSDSSPHTLFEAVLQAAEQLDASCTLLVIATKSVIDQLMPLVQSPLASTNHSQKPALIRFREVADTIAMGDDPIGSVRRKKGSSIVVGIRLLKKQQLDAFVSCGNTGALIASAALSLPMLPGIKRPALLVDLPTERGCITVLDVGSTVSAKARYLIQFALLGAAYRHVMHQVLNPAVGLLNVGAESKKGSSELRGAYEYLMEHAEELAKSFHFVGNVEGRDVFKGLVDVLVTDGFSGNVLLKSVQGVAAFIFGALAKSLQAEAPVEFRAAFDVLQKQFNYAEYPGAMVCGVDGVVIKAHGTGSSKALYSSIMGAANYIQKDVIARLKAQLVSP